MKSNLILCGLMLSAINANASAGINITNNATAGPNQPNTQVGSLAPVQGRWSISFSMYSHGIDFGDASQLIWSFYSKAGNSAFVGFSDSYQTPGNPSTVQTTLMTPNLICWSFGHGKGPLNCSTEVLAQGILSTQQFNHSMAIIDGGLNAAIQGDGSLLITLGPTASGDSQAVDSLSAGLAHSVNPDLTGWMNGLGIRCNSAQHVCEITLYAPKKP